MNEKSIWFLLFHMDCVIYQNLDEIIFLKLFQSKASERGDQLLMRISMLFQFVTCNFSG